MSKKMLFGISLIILLATGLSADYNTGVKYYNKYIKKSTHLKSTQFLKEYNLTTKEEIECLVEHDKIFEAVLKDIGLSDKKIKKVMKHKEDIKDFLNGVLEGKIPAGCS